MKKSFYIPLLFVAILWVSCNNNAGDPGKKTESATVDSLKSDLDDAHNIGMAKMGRLTRAEQETRRLLDSIRQLPGKAKQAAAPLQARLDSLQKELQYAEFSMEKWMQEFRWDSTFDDVDQKIDYYRKEKLKVAVVKENILKGIEKADSVLKSKL